MSPVRTLTDEQIAEIRKRWRAGETAKAIASDYSVHPNTVSRYIRMLPGYKRGGWPHPSKGRRGTPKKLTAEQVAQIRREHDLLVSQTKLAKKYGVHQSLISLIVSGKSWPTEGT